jgi:hypothetical protein
MILVLLLLMDVHGVVVNPLVVSTTATAIIKPTNAAKDTFMMMMMMMMKRKMGFIYEIIDCTIGRKQSRVNIV